MFKGKQLIYSLIAAAVVTVVAGTGVLQRLDRWVQDALFQRPGVTSPDILIIGIDEEALADLGPYQTWDRNVMASALEALAADPGKKPAVTAIDVLYAGETSRQADLRLAEAAGELGNVVTACMAEFGERITWENGLVSSYDTDVVIGFEQPYEALRRCTVQGHINAMNDVDGVVRHGLLYVEPELNGADGRVPSMSRMAARLFLEQQERELQAADDAGTAGKADDAGAAGKADDAGAAGKADDAGAAGKADDAGADEADGSDPGSAWITEAAGTDEADGRFFYIPYTGRPGDFYDGVSLSRLIRGEIPPDYWAGKIVLIGPYATALQDAYFTPIDKGTQMFGVEIQANMIQSFLENNARRELPQLPQLAVLFVLCAAAMMLLMNMSVLAASLLAGSLAAMGPVCAFNLYNIGLVTHPLWVPVGVAWVYILAMAVHYVRTARERQALALEKERIAAELSLATRIQISALPKEFPNREKFHVYASMTPAKEVGGDFYDFFMIDEDHLGLVIADASGKGVPAALFMMVSSALIRNAAMGEYSPAKVLMTVNHQLCTRNPEEMFVTVWLGVLEVPTGKLTAANAGHEYPILKRPGESFELFKDRHGLVIGAMDGARYREYEIQLEPGAKLFVYTDGLSEATNASTEQFGTDRTIEALRAREDGSPEELVGAVHDAVDAFVADAPQFDDLTMLCLEYR